MFFFLNNFLIYDIYNIQVLQFDLQLKKNLFKNFLYFICFEFKYFLLNFSLQNQLYSKVYYIIRTFSYNLSYKIKKSIFKTKKKQIISGFLLKMLFKNLYDFMLYFDFFRFFFVRFLFIYKQLFGISFLLQKNYLKDHINSGYLKIYFNDLTFRVNNLMDSLLNRENFIYFFENINVFYNLFFGFFHSYKIIYNFLTFFGFFIIKYKKFIKQYKLFVFYTIIM